MRSSKRIALRMPLSSFFRRHAGIGSLLATITNALALFLIFRISYGLLGPSVVGLWALLQGIMLISRLSDVGSSGNITRLVAIAHVSGAGVRLTNFIAVGFIVSVAPILILGLAVMIPTYYYVEATNHIDVSNTQLIELIGCSVSFGVFSAVGAILSGCLDGMGLMALRGYLSCVANILFVACGYVFIKRFGAFGLGLAYVCLALTMIALLSFGLLLAHTNKNFDSKTISLSELLHQSVGFNASFFMIGVCRLLLDPACKILIGAYSGLEAVAIFDLANKITTQARILYSSPLQSLLPVVSRETSEVNALLQTRLLRWNETVVRWPLYTMSAVVLISGWLSLFSFKKVDTSFMFEVAVLGFANAITTFGLVGYYIEVGSGKLKQLLAVHIKMATLNICLGIILGYMFGAAGVTLGYSMALSYTGIACLKFVFKKAKDVLSFLGNQTRLEFAIFAASTFVSWMTMVAAPSLPSPLQNGILGTSCAIVGVIFLCREAGKFLVQYFGGGK